MYKKRDASATLFAVSVLGTYFECQGVKCIYLNFTLWPCMETFVVQSRQVWATPQLRTHLPNTRCGSQVTMCTCSGSKILKKGKIDSFCFKWSTRSIIVKTTRFSTEQLKISKYTWIKYMWSQVLFCQSNPIAFLRYSLPSCETGLHGAMFKNFFLVWGRTKRKVSFYSLSIIRLTDLAEKIWKLICLLLDYEWRSFNIWRHYECLNLCGSPREILFHLVRR